jgi:hypothetical protein
MNLRQKIRDLLGRLPFVVELLWFWRINRLDSRFNLQSLHDFLPQVLKQISCFTSEKPRGKKIFLFAITHYWIDQIVQTGLVLTGMGYQVTVGYLPDANWNKPTSRYDYRVQNLYARGILSKTRPWLTPVSFMDVRQVRSLPARLQSQVDKVTIIDTQYILQNESVDSNDAIYKMRKKRNDSAARAALAYFQQHRPDVVIVPNGLILEFGAVYEVSRYLGLNTVTYEFGDSANHVWLSRNVQVVRHETDDLWAARRDIPLTDTQRQWLASFFQRRQRPESDNNFIWLSQPAEVKGGSEVRARLGLDARPVVLLATNVLGDSLTLDRQVFSPTMIEWIKRTIQYFVGHPEVQLVIRIHPGESIMVGPTSAGEVIKQVLPIPPEHIHVVGAKDSINTYDLLDITDLGLVYVTTTGLEMSARGIPVIVGGKTHYRGRGFTIDPNSWDEYFKSLDETLTRLPGYRLTSEQLEAAWNYAYRFFREFPRPFPWHLAKRWQDFEVRPLEYVLGEGFAQYEATFRYLAGEPIDWKNIDAEKESPVDDSGNTSILRDLLNKEQDQ